MQRKVIWHYDTPCVGIGPHTFAACYHVTLGAGGGTIGDVTGTHSEWLPGWCDKVASNGIQYPLHVWGFVGRSDVGDVTYFKADRPLLADMIHPIAKVIGPSIEMWFRGGGKANVETMNVLRHDENFVYVEYDFTTRPLSMSGGVAWQGAELVGVVSFQDGDHSMGLSRIKDDGGVIKLPPVKPVDPVLDNDLENAIVSIMVAKSRLDLAVGILQKKLTQ